VEEEMKLFASIAGFAAVTLMLSAPAVHAQDPAKTDPAHFKVELDNDRARVLHVTVAPNTKIELHELDDAVVVPLADYESTLKMNGQTVKVERVTGKAAWVPAGGREFEAGSRGVDALLIEIKHAK
jgi:beta-alanine degradation protein BauB